MSMNFFLTVLFFSFSYGEIGMAKTKVCAQYSIDLSHALKGEKKDILSSLGSSLSTFGVADLPSQQWLEVILVEDHSEDGEEGISWLVKPQPNRKYQGKNGGMAAFTPKTDGLYFFATDSKLWLDIVDTKTSKIVPAKKVEAQENCQRVKQVFSGYALKAERRYLLQISLNSEGAAKLFIGLQPQVSNSSKRSIK